MYRISLQGKVKSRTRIKILWFWIQGKWREDPFNFSQDVQVKPFSQTFKLGDFSAVATASETEITVALRYKGMPLGMELVPYLAAWAKPNVLPFRCEPIKGIIIEGTLRVERV